MKQLKAPRKTGKWTRSDVPHSGWQCLEVRDEGTVCEMCEVQTITYNHVMTHELLPGVALDCGCVCATYMTGNAEQERLREALYKWRNAFRKQKTPIEKLRRKGWRGSHFTSGEHEWSHYDDGTKYYGPGFIVRVSNRDGWQYRVRRNWWDRQDTSGHIHGGPFDTDIDAALAGIERAELLRADPRWMEADREAEAVHVAVAKARREAESLHYAIGQMDETGNADLAAALKQGGITIFDAFNEMRERRKAEETAAEYARSEAGGQS